MCVDQRNWCICWFFTHILKNACSRSKVPSKTSRPYIYDVKFLAFLGAPYIYDISRLRFNIDFAPKHIYIYIVPRTYVILLNYYIYRHLLSRL
jgi:hypothetical protein